MSTTLLKGLRKCWPTFFQKESLSSFVFLRTASFSFWQERQGGKGKNNYFVTRGCLDRRKGGVKTIQLQQIENGNTVCKVSCWGIVSFWCKRQSSLLSSNWVSQICLRNPSTKEHHKQEARDTVCGDQRLLWKRNFLDLSLKVRFMLHIFLLSQSTQTCKTFEKGGNFWLQVCARFRSRHLVNRVYDLVNPMIWEKWSDCWGLSDNPGISGIWGEYSLIEMSRWSIEMRWIFPETAGNLLVSQKEVKSAWSTFCIHVFMLSEANPIWVRNIMPLFLGKQLLDKTRTSCRALNISLGFRWNANTVFPSTDIKDIKMQFVCRSLALGRE